MKHRPAAGFTLIEALLSVLVLSIGLLGLAQLQARLWLSSGQLHARDTARQLGQDRLEMASLSQFAGTGSASTPVHRGTTDYVTELQVTTGGRLSTATVHVRWQSPAGLESLSFTTMAENTRQPADARFLLPGH